MQFPKILRLTGFFVFLLAQGAVASDRMALWSIIHDQCVAHHLQNNTDAPCVRVEIKAPETSGYAILKDRNGIAQLLLIPTAQISGIEDQKLQTDPVNYLAKAWDERGTLATYLQKPVDDRMVSLAINSPQGRSQDQLHIHIDCLAPNARALIDGQMAAIHIGWSEPIVLLNGHGYRALRLSKATFAATNLFIMLAQTWPDQSKVKNLTLVVVASGETPESDLLVLGGESNLLTGNFGSGEEFQDHSCAIAGR